MRRFDKKKNIQKANLIAETRYLESKGVIKESFYDVDETPIEGVKLKVDAANKLISKGNPMVIEYHKGNDKFLIRLSKPVEIIEDSEVVMYTFEISNDGESYRPMKKDRYYNNTKRTIVNGPTDLEAFNSDMSMIISGMENELNNMATLITSDNKYEAVPKVINYVGSDEGLS